MSSRQFWLISTLLAIIAASLDQHETLIIFLVTWIVQGYDQYKRRQEEK